MLNQQTINDLASNLTSALPPGLEAVRADIEKNFRAVLQAQMSKLDLVTREEFEVQQAVLKQAGERISTLLSQVDKLEQTLNDK